MLLLRSSQLVLPVFLEHLMILPLGGPWDLSLVREVELMLRALLGMGMGAALLLPLLLLWCVASQSLLSKASEISSVSAS